MSMNRSDLVQRIILLDQFAEKVKAESQALRSVLMLDAKAEFEEQGIATTWRIPEVVTVVTKTTHTSVSVSDPAAFLRWVGKRYPSEIEEVLRVRPAWQTAFLGALTADADPETGEVIPGLKVKEGGDFQGIAITATTAAKELFGAIAQRAVGQIAAPMLEASSADPS